MSVRVSRLFMALVATSVLSACNSIIDVRGNRPLPQSLDQIVPGKVTKSDVVALIGTPASTSLFSDDQWFYISSRFETWAFFQPVELDREVIEIDFDRAGTVSAVQRLGLDDGREVAMIPRETPAPGKELTVLEQILGNVGRYNKPIDDKGSK